MANNCTTPRNTATSNDFLRERMSGFLRKKIGVGRPLTAQQVSGATGIPERTLRAIIAGDGTATLAHFASLVAFFGPALIEATFDGIVAAKASDVARADYLRQVNAASAALQGIEQMAKLIAGHAAQIVERV